MFYDKIWSNFVNYVSSFEPYAADKDKFIRYFGNPAGKSPGFKTRSLGWYNPVSSRFKFNCGYRMCINVYLSCDHGCRYCYVNSYSAGVGKGRRRSRFIETLKQDIADFRSLGMPPGPVHVSNSTDPFQEQLEKRFRDTYNTLKILAENKDLFSEITILTKNPCFMFEDTAYLDNLESMKTKLNIEITIPFFRDNYKLYEPYAPHPQARLEAMNKLLHMGFNVRLRLDPIFPAESGIQTKDDIINILDSSVGVQCVISKPLRLVIPKNKVSDEFFDEMKSFYEGGKQNGVLRHHTRYVYSADRSAKEMEHLQDECVKRNIPLVHCMETVLVNEVGIPIIKSKLGGGKHQC